MFTDGWLSVWREYQDQLLKGKRFVLSLWKTETTPDCEGWIERSPDVRMQPKYLWETFHIFTWFSLHNVNIMTPDASVLVMRLTEQFEDESVAILLVIIKRWWDTLELCPVLKQTNLWELNDCGLFFNTTLTQDKLYFFHYIYSSTHPSSVFILPHFLCSPGFSSLFLLSIVLEIV